MWLIHLVTDKVVVSQAACLLAIHLGSRRALAARIANLQLTPPAKDQSTAAAAEPDDMITPPWYRRFHSNSRAFTVRGVLMMLLAGEFIVLVILPFVASRLVFDTFWTVLTGVAMSAIIFGNLTFLFAGPLKMSFERPSGHNHLTLNLDFQRGDTWLGSKRPRIAASVAVAAGMLAHAAYDPDSYVPAILAGSVILALYTAGGLFPQQSTRGLTLVSFGLIAVSIAMMALIGIVILLVQSFGLGDPIENPNNDTPNVDETEQQFLFMPPWVSRVSGSYTYALAALPITFLVSLAMRYDHLKSASDSDISKAAPGEAVYVSRHPVRRSSSMYRLAMITLATCYAVVDFAFYWSQVAASDDGRTPSRDNDMDRDTVCMVVTIVVDLVVPAVLASFARSKGEGPAWWTYSESWAPAEEHQEEFGDSQKLDLDVEDQEGTQQACDHKAVAA